MELVQHIGEMFLQAGEKVLNMLEGDDWDYAAFQLDLERLLNEFGKEICREVMENADACLRENPKEREGWVVERKDDAKSVLTPFGQISGYCVPQRKLRGKRPKKLAKKVSVGGPNQLWQVNVKYGYISGADRFFFWLSAIDVYIRGWLGII